MADGRQPFGCARAGFPKISRRYRTVVEIRLSEASFCVDARPDGSATTHGSVAHTKEERVWRPAMAKKTTSCPPLTHPFRLVYSRHALTSIPTVVCGKWFRK